MEFWSRLSDPNTDSGLLLEIVKDLKRGNIQVELKDSSTLHAKIYMADRLLAIFGSCNLSSSGFEENLEIAALVSEPEIRQVCAVADGIENEMKTVGFDDLVYFVEHQRPTILQQQTTPPPITVVPIWRQKGTVVAKEWKETVPAPPAPGSARPTETINPMDVFERGLKLLNEHQEHISRLDIGSFTGQKVKIIVFPEDFLRSMMDARWAKGQPPFQELEGKIVGEHKPMRATQSYTNSTLTGEEKMTWKFLPKHARTKDLIFANFPVKKNPLEGREVHYISSIKKI